MDWRVILFALWNACLFDVELTYVFSIFDLPFYLLLGQLMLATIAIHYNAFGYGDLYSFQSVENLSPVPQVVLHGQIIDHFRFVLFHIGDCFL